MGFLLHHKRCRWDKIPVYRLF